MEISTGQLEEAKNPSLTEKTGPQEVGLIDQIRAIKDRNSPEYRNKVRELESVLGVDRISVFKTANRSIFEENLNAMSVTQVQDFARRLRIDPFGSLSSLKTRLMRQFDSQNPHSMSYVVPQPSEQEFLSTEQRDALQKIINHG